MQLSLIAPEFKAGDRVIVCDLAGNWLGTVERVEGCQVFVGNGTSEALSHAPEQLRSLTAEQEAHAEEAEVLRARMQWVQEMKERDRPRVDCRQCAHRTGEGSIYSCAKLVYGWESPVNYGFHIGCSEFESQL